MSNRKNRVLGFIIACIIGIILIIIGGIIVQVGDDIEAEPGSIEALWKEIPDVMGWAFIIGGIIIIIIGLLFLLGLKKTLSI